MHPSHGFTMPISNTQMSSWVYGFHVDVLTSSTILRTVKEMDEKPVLPLVDAYSPKQSGNKMEILNISTSLKR